MKNAMKDDNTLLPGEAELHAYVDGRLDAAGRAAVEARLAGDAEAAERVRAWTEQRDALRALHAGLMDEPIPEHLLHAADQLHHRSTRFAQWQRWGGMAATVLLAFGLGWGGHVQWQASGFGVGSSRPTADASRWDAAARSACRRRRSLWRFPQYRRWRR